MPSGDPFCSVHGFQPCSCRDLPRSAPITDYNRGYLDAIRAASEPRASGLRKLSDMPRPCLSPEHNPPSMIVLDPGTYEYTCPSCRARVIFTVGGVYCEASE